MQLQSSGEMSNSQGLLALGSQYSTSTAALLWVVRGVYLSLHTVHPVSCCLVLELIVYFSHWHSSKNLPLQITYYWVNNSKYIYLQNCIEICWLKPPPLQEIFNNFVCGEHKFVANKKVTNFSTRVDQTDRIFYELQKTLSFL